MPQLLPCTDSGKYWLLSGWLECLHIEPPSHLAWLFPLQFGVSGLLSFEQEWKAAGLLQFANRAGLLRRACFGDSCCRLS